MSRRGREEKKKKKKKKGKGEREKVNAFQRPGLGAGCRTQWGSAVALWPYWHDFCMLTAHILD